MRGKLTNSVVESFAGGERYTTGKRVGELIEQPVLWDTVLKGFGLRYAIKSQTRTYIYQGRVKGKPNSERTITIGRHNDPWRVDQARARATALKAQMLDGIDPVAERERAAAAAVAQAEIGKATSITLREGLAHYTEHKRTKHGPLRPKTKDSIKDNIERHLAAWLDKPMATTVTREACFTRFTEMSEKEGIKATANLVFVYLRAICNHIRKLTASEDGTPRIFIANPVTLMLDIRKLNPEPKRKGRIPRERIGHVWNALRARAVEGRTDVERGAADWLSTVVLSGLRLTESGALMKEHVDLKANTLHIPGDVDGIEGFHGTKNHHGLTLPLSTPLIEILTPRLTTSDADTPAARRRHRERADAFCFPGFGTKRPYLTDPRATLELISEAAGCHITTHDLRRTFEDILKYAKVDPDDRRLVLNHLDSGDVHQGSYANDDSPDALRPSMEAAAQWVLEQARIAAAPNIVQFPQKRA